MPINSTVSQQSQVQQYSFSDHSDFSELVKYANLASVAYCLNKGLSDSFAIGKQKSSCPSPACQHEGISHFKIIKTFRFNAWFDVGSCFVAVDHAAQTLYLTFRGTNLAQDWLNNLDAFLVDYEPLVFLETNKINAELNTKCKGCKIHKGFSAFVKHNGAEVVQYIIDLKKKWPLYHVVVTGHSLGGAMALICGVELRLMGYDTLVVTLAGPKVGNAQFVEYANKLFKTDELIKHIDKHDSFETLDIGYVRMVHKHDIVPLLPPTKHYMHAGYEYFLSSRGMEQTPKLVVRRAKDYVEDCDLSYMDMIPSEFSRADHVNYFFKVTSCKPREDQ